MSLPPSFDPQPSEQPATPTADVPPVPPAAPGYPAPQAPSADPAAPGYAGPAAYAAPAAGAAPAYSAPAPGYAAPAPAPAGRGMAIAGLICAFLVAPVGIILSIIALVQLNRSGGSKGLAIAGIIVGVVVTIGAIIGAIVTFTLAAGLLGNIVEMCAQLGPGEWEVNGVTYTCD